MDGHEMDSHWLYLEYVDDLALIRHLFINENRGHNENLNFGTDRRKIDENDYMFRDWRTVIGVIGFCCHMIHFEWVPGAFKLLSQLVFAVVQLQSNLRIFYHKIFNKQILETNTKPH